MQKRLHACASKNTCCGCRAACKQFVNSCIWHLVSTFCAGGSRRRGLSAPLRRAELTFGRPCWRPARRPPASSSGRCSCLPAAPLSGCCRSSGCSPGSRTSTKPAPSRLSLAISSLYLLLSSESSACIKPDAHFFCFFFSSRTG